MGVLQAEGHTVEYTCGNCGAALMHADEIEVTGSSLSASVFPWPDLTSYCEASLRASCSLQHCVHCRLLPVRSDLSVNTRLLTQLAPIDHGRPLNSSSRTPFVWSACEST